MTDDAGVDSYYPDCCGYLPGRDRKMTGDAGDDTYYPGCSGYLPGCGRRMTGDPGDDSYYHPDCSGYLPGRGRKITGAGEVTATTRLPVRHRPRTRSGSPGEDGGVVLILEGQGHHSWDFFTSYLWTVYALSWLASHLSTLLVACHGQWRIHEPRRRPL